MSRQKELEDYSKSLNCHFNWDLDETSTDVNINCNIEQLEHKLLTDVKGNPPVAFKVYLLLAFAHTVGDLTRNVDYSKALGYIESAESIAKTISEKYLVNANKLWILKKKRDTRLAQALVRTVKEFEGKLSSEDKSDLCLTEAFSLSRFTVSGYERALAKYKEAISLNP